MNVARALWMSLKYLTLSLIIWNSISTSSAHHEKPKKYLMAALGDSITAGFIADTHIQTLEPGFVLNLPPFTNKKSDSWASGKSIRSHALQLEKSLEQHGDFTPVAALNEAIPGNKVQDVIAQAQKIKQAMESGKYQSLKYVVLLIGANDACAKETSLGTPEETIREGLRETFDILSQIGQDEPIRILMSGIPKIPDLGRLEVTQVKTIFGLTCHTFRDEFLRSCHSLLNWKSNGEYESRVAVVENINRILADAAQEANSRHPNLQVVFTNQLFNTVIDPELLAMDCFHPSREGQQTISNTLWSEQPWFSILNQ